MGNLCSVWSSSRKGKSLVVVKETEPRRSFDGELRLGDYKKSSDEKGFIFRRTSDENVPDLRLLSDGEMTNIPNHWILNRKVEDGRTVSMELMPSGSEDVRWTKPPLDRNLGFELRTEGKSSSLRTKPLEDIEEVFIALTNEEEIEVDLALQIPKRSSSWSDVLVMHKPSNIEISREMMCCLKCGGWLNDEVINLYLELLKEREKREPNKFLKCHFFNTFFYKKMTSGHDRYDFKAVRRWTTQRKIGYNLIDCDKIFVPIHKEKHWCLAVIHVKERKFQYLDSFGGINVEVLTLLGRYLKDEAKDKSNVDINLDTWDEEFVHGGIPLQTNWWDCGMFMLKYTDFYSRGLGLRFGQENMDYFRRRTVNELLNLRAD